MIYNKYIILVTNLSSFITLYFGYKYKQYILAYYIFLTSIFSFIFHLFNEFNYLVSYDILNFFRIIDFLYSYQSIYITIISLFLDFNHFIYNYNVIMTPLFLWLAINQSEKHNFLTIIIPSLSASTFPLFYFQRNNFIKPLIKSKYLIILLLMTLSNIYVYINEHKYSDYYIFHSIHHILCFSIPSIVILYKNNNKKFNTHYLLDFQFIERKRNNSNDISLNV
jgi:hypothetical protein